MCITSGDHLSRLQTAAPWYTATFCSCRITAAAAAAAAALSKPSSPSAFRKLPQLGGLRTGFTTVLWAWSCSSISSARRHLLLNLPLDPEVRHLQPIPQGHQ